MATKAKGKSTKQAPPTSSGWPLWAIWVPLVLILLVAGLWAAYLLLGGNSSTDKQTPVAAPTEQPTQTTGKSGRPTAPVDEDRQATAQEALAMLKQAREIARQPNFDQILQQVAAGDESGLPKDFVARFRFTDQVQEDKDIRASSLLAVLQLGEVMEKNLPKGQKLDLLTPQAWKYVYVDQQAGNAYVPLTIFLGSKAAFSFEYVWVDGEWVFTPYSLIDAISTANTAANGAQDMANGLEQSSGAQP